MCAVAILLTVCARLDLSRGSGPGVTFECLIYVVAGFIVASRQWVIVWRALRLVVMFIGLRENRIQCTWRCHMPYIWDTRNGVAMKADENSI